MQRIKSLVVRRPAVEAAGDRSDFATPNLPTLRKRLLTLPCGIGLGDSRTEVLAKIRRFLDTYQPANHYSEELGALACVREALRGAELGGYGIGAALVNASDEVLHAAHNRQLQRCRSDLHAEMQLLNEFEELPQFRKYLAQPEFTGRSGTFFTEPLTLYASTEPCPMCFTRLVIVGVKARYVAPGPDDGMASRASKLPRFWYELSRRHEARPAQASPVLRQLAHALFYSYLLE